jgi:hypothetical protein
MAAVRERLTAELLRWRRETNDPLLDAGKLGRLVDEDRARVALLKRDGPKNAPPWRYPEYLYGSAEN